MSEDKLMQKTMDASFLAENFHEGASTGMENLRGEDYAKPKLLLCQAQTPHRKKDKEVYIEGLDEGMFFNIISREIYGEEIEVIPVHAGYPYANEYDANGRVVEFNIPLDDARLSPSIDANGKRTPPTGKVCIDYTMLVSSHNLDPVVWTAKGAQRSVAKAMNIACKSSLELGGKRFPNPPFYARAFPFKSVEGNNDSRAISLGIPRVVTKFEFKAAAALAKAIQETADQEADRF